MSKEGQYEFDFDAGVRAEAEKRKQAFASADDMFAVMRKDPQYERYGDDALRDLEDASFRMQEKNKKEGTASRFQIHQKSIDGESPKYRNET